ncbi:DUF6233 domain-containing protein [Streptomyces sp. NPDC059456]|uniref:DUF6233 domain-containing protein n=1 Tax=Streptomyces sp. NPDC059456 TaxID=3346838 RepID=UPI0036A370AD
MQGRAAGTVRELSVAILPPDATRLRTLVTYLRGELRRTKAALSAAEEQEAAGARACGVAGGTRDRGGPAPGPRPCRGGCWDSSRRCAPASAAQVRRLLAGGVSACPRCRPDTALGVLE